MRDLEYQNRVLSVLDAYLDVLKTHKQEADRAAALLRANPGVRLAVPDFTADAWADMRARGDLPPVAGDRPDFSPRQDQTGRPVPNVTLKVPTGGGKTYLAVESLSRIFGRYVGRNTGMVLWIVPNEAIYAQTLRRLKDRRDPYRQVLDRAAAGRVRVLEKTARLDKRDTDAHLCVMVLMLPSANRRARETLKLFRDRGDVHGFFPPASGAAHAAIRAEVPNLDIYDLGDGVASQETIKDSLGNALRVLRPVVVLDEGQKAVSSLAFETIYGFNPRFVMELTATPKAAGGRGQPTRYPNILVEVTGTELNDEGMIKMPLRIDARIGSSWQDVLDAALGLLNDLQGRADAHRGDGGKYIRPILIVQVERTGKDTNDGHHIHSENVRDRLLSLGLHPDEVAIKTADQNDLAQPENLDLLSERNRVRVIITKQALQEGWDCPFAYVLCGLAARSDLTGMTQIVGRILRQPWAAKTDVPALDQAYVITHQARTADVVEKIKAALEGEGLGDLVVSVSSGDGERGPPLGARSIPRRAAFRGLDIYLPQVITLADGAPRPLDYEVDVLSGLDWRSFDPARIAKDVPEEPLASPGHVRMIRVGHDDEPRLVDEAAEAPEAVRAFDPVFVTRCIGDIIPNPFVARTVVARFVGHLRARGHDDEWFAQNAGALLDFLRTGLASERDQQAENLFRDGVRAGLIEFRLRTDEHAWRMPDEIYTTLGGQEPRLRGLAGDPLQRSLFETLYEAEFSNPDERTVAVHIDERKTVHWWHRNVARAQYGLQGWRRHRVYPDFIFAAPTAMNEPRIFILETKGEQLAANLDTAYKSAFMSLLTETFDASAATHAGSLNLVHHDGTTVRCDLVMLNEVPAALPALLSG